MEYDFVVKRLILFRPDDAHRWERGTGVDDASAACTCIPAVPPAALTFPS